MKCPLRGHALLLALLLTGGAAFAADGMPKTAPAVQPAAQRPGHAGIASADFPATNAGFKVLAKGGNAFDAASDPRRPSGLDKVE